MKVLNCLRLGAIFPLAFTILGLFSSFSWIYDLGDSTVTAKHHRNGFFSIEAEADRGGGSELTYSRRFYEKAQKGDRLHFGFHYMTLRRDGKLIAVEIPEDTIVLLVWLVVGFFPALAFLPEAKVPKALLLLLGIVEVLYIFVMCLGLFGSLG